MNALIANWTKLCVGVCLIIITIGYVTGHVTSNDLVGIVAGLGGVHALTSGITGMKS